MLSATEIRVLTFAAGPYTSKGLEYPLEDLQRTLQLNSLDEAAELCEAVGLEISMMSDSAASAVIPKVRHVHPAHPSTYIPPWLLPRTAYCLSSRSLDRHSIGIPRHSMK